MPEPTLRRSNGRKVVRLTVRNGPPSPAIPSPGLYQRFTDRQPSPSPTNDVFAFPKSRPTNIFPSVLTPFSLLDQALNRKNVTQFLFVAPQYLMALETVLEQMGTTPFLDVTPGLELVWTAEILWIVVSSFVVSLDSLKCPPRQVSPMEIMRNAFRHAEEAYILLSDLAHIIVKITKLSLPVAEWNLLDNNRINTSSSTENTTHSSRNTRPGTPIPQSGPSTQNPTLSHPHLQRRPCTSGSPSAPLTTPAHTPLHSNTDPTSLPFRLQSEPPRPIGRHSFRNSALYFPNDPKHPERDVAMPTLTNMSASYALDNVGQIKSANFPALIYFLTSKQCVQDPELKDIIFTYFRYFAKPLEFFSALVQRFEEQRPDGLSEEERRVWDNNLVITRIRVPKAMLDWLKHYWKQEDNTVLDYMEAFVEKYIQTSIPVLFDLQKAIKIKKEVPDLMTRAHKTSIISAPQKPLPYIPPTGFIFPSESTYLTSVTEQLQKFNSARGREEFVRQLTLVLSFKFQNVDPYDAVALWQAADNPNHRDMPGARALADIVTFVNALMLLVSSTIIQPVDSADRAHAIVFWLSVASLCIHHRNFIAACSIQNGVGHSSVRRMKETILLVPLASKTEYSHHERFFDGKGNYSHYRNELSESLSSPTLPLTLVHSRDILSASMLPSLIKDERERRGGNNRSGRPTELIHLNNFRVMRNTIKILESSHIPYPFNYDAPFAEWLNNQLQRYSYDKPENGKILEELHSCSIQIEPRNDSLNHVNNAWEYIGTKSRWGGWTLKEAKRLG